MELPSDSFVASRQVGDATVTVIPFGSFVLPHSALHQDDVPEWVWRPAIPDAEPEGNVPHGSSAAHIRLGTASILVDTANREDFPADIAAAGRLVRSPGLVPGLAAIGVLPDQITHVLFTHAHGDHLGGAVELRDGAFVPRFRNARHLLNRLDWDVNPDRQNPESQLVVRLGPVARAGLLELVEEDVEIVPGVTILHAPGESPGHCVVRVHSRGETFYALGDMLHHPAQVEHLEWMNPGFAGRDPVTMRATRECILGRATGEGALLTYSHAPFPSRSPFGRVTRVNGGYRWQEA